MKKLQDDKWAAPKTEDLQDLAESQKDKTKKYIEM